MNGLRLRRRGKGNDKMKETPKGVLFNNIFQKSFSDQNQNPKL
jgi:hypothetical protein